MRQKGNGGPRKVVRPSGARPQRRTDQGRRNPSGAGGCGPLVLTAVVDVPGALAFEAEVKIGSPTNGELVETHSPSFTGTTEDTENDLTLTIYAGHEVAGPPVHAPLTTLRAPSEGLWSLGPVESLPDGTYTAQATQPGVMGLFTYDSPPVTFIVATPPRVTLAAPASPSSDTTPVFSGSAGTEVDDLPNVIVRIYPGSGHSTAPLQTLEARASKGSWTSPPTSHLADGTYTAVAEQATEHGVLGVSEARTFVVETPPAVTLNTVASPRTTPRRALAAPRAPKSTISRR